MKSFFILLLATGCATQPVAKVAALPEITRAIGVVPPPRTVKVSWNNPNGTPDIVVVLQHSQDLTLAKAEWPVCYVGLDEFCVLPMLDWDFFIAYCSNVVTGEVSEYAQ